MPPKSKEAELPLYSKFPENISAALKKAGYKQRMSTAQLEKTLRHSHCTLPQIGERKKIVDDHDITESALVFNVHLDQQNYALLYITTTLAQEREKCQWHLHSCTRISREHKGEQIRSVSQAVRYLLDEHSVVVR